MIMNLDQTPSRIAPVSGRTLDIKENSHVAIGGRSIHQNKTLNTFWIKLCIFYFIVFWLVMIFCYYFVYLILFSFSLFYVLWYFMLIYSHNLNKNELLIVYPTFICFVCYEDYNYHHYWVLLTNKPSSHILTSFYQCNSCTEERLNEAYPGTTFQRVFC